MEAPEQTHTRKASSQLRRADVDGGSWCSALGFVWNLENGLPMVSLYPLDQTTGDPPRPTGIEGRLATSSGEVAGLTSSSKLDWPSRFCRTSANKNTTKQTAFFRKVSNLDCI